MSCFVMDGSSSAGGSGVVFGERVDAVLVHADPLAARVLRRFPGADILSFFSLQRPHDAGRNTGGEGVWRNVARDDGSGGDDGAAADRDAGEHGRVSADPDIVADRDGLRNADAAAALSRKL